MPMDFFWCRSSGDVCISKQLFHLLMIPRSVSGPDRISFFDIFWYCQSCHAKLNFIFYIFKLAIPDICTQVA